MEGVLAGLGVAAWVGAVSLSFSHSNGQGREDEAKKAIGLIRLLRVVGCFMVMLVVGLRVQRHGSCAAAALPRGWIVRAYEKVVGRRRTRGVM